MSTKTEKFEEYAIVEMMGHRKIAGKITESEIGGSTLLRVDVLDPEGEFDRTEYIGVSSIYCLTIVKKEIAEAVARNYTPKPSFAYDLQTSVRALPAHEDFEDADEDI
jgi:hypothetical protein